VEYGAYTHRDVIRHSCSAGDIAVDNAAAQVPLLSPSPLHSAAPHFPRSLSCVELIIMVVELQLDT
jgi:hypothetical protein